MVTEILLEAAVLADCIFFVIRLFADEGVASTVKLPGLALDSTTTVNWHDF